MAGFNTGLNGILYVDRERFDSVEMIKTPLTLYIVDNGGSFSLYLGNVPLAADNGAYDPSAVRSETVRRIAAMPESEYAKLQTIDTETEYHIYKD